MKKLYNLIISLILFEFLKADETDNCGYYGPAGTQIEEDLDNCFTKNVKDSRVRMSIGFELCFGFNYSKLNSTIAQPIEKFQNKTNTDLIDLSLKTCRIAEADRPQDDDGIDFEKEQKSLEDCRKFFDIAIEAMYNEQATVDTFLNENDELLRPILKDEEMIEELKKIIDKKISPIDDCKEPQIILRNKMIKKFLEMYLNKIASPDMPSFTWESLDVLLHPEVYMLKNDKFSMPDFKHYQVTTATSTKEILLPKKRAIVMQKRRYPIGEGTEEKLQNTDDSSEEGFFASLFAGSSEEDKNLKRKIEKVEVDNKWGEQPYEFSLRQKDKEIKEKEKKKKIKEKKENVVVENYWDSDIKIKKKRFTDEDFNSYRIRGWDVDKKLAKLFGMKKLI